MKMYIKTVFKYFDYIQSCTSRNDNIYHQYFFKLSILLCGKNYPKFHSEYLYLPRYLKSGIFCGAAYFYIKLNSKHMCILFYLFVIHAFMFLLFSK